MADEHSIPLTANILDGVGIGLWAVEIDDGCAPRMTANPTMLKLLGLEEGVSADSTYDCKSDHAQVAWA